MGRAVKRVVLTQRTMVASTGEVRDCLDQAWAPLLTGWGYVPVPLPTLVGDVAPVLDAVAPEAVILTGGDDLAGMAGPAGVDGVDPTPQRDEVEAAVVAWCRASAIPIVGVCRGMQLLARSNGATLVPVDGHVARRHRVLLEGAPLHRDGSDEVNSYHRFAVAGAGVPTGVRPFAWDDDRNIEAFVHRHRPEAGLMWHPERERERDPGAGSWPVLVLRALLEGVAG
jgi:N5-(cytidine 5'-diphosphoramidyl)-L-glutamine hydrolase